MRIMFVNMATGGAASYSSCSASVLVPQDNGVQPADNVSKRSCISSADSATM